MPRLNIRIRRTDNDLRFRNLELKGTAELEPSSLEMPAKIQYVSGAHECTDPGLAGVLEVA